MSKSLKAALIVLVVLLLALARWASRDAVPAEAAFEQRLRRTITAKGQPAERLALQERMAHYGVPGLGVAIIEGCEVVEARGYGTAAPGGPAVQADTLFQAASISKPVAALGALRLVERGALSLDADVRPALESWTLPDSPLLEGHPVTLRSLLSHSAGLNVHGFGGYPVGAPLPTAAQILDGQAPADSEPVRVQAAPGSRWKYSGGGFVVTQLLMTDVTGQPFPALMQELVLGPVGMEDSSFSQPLPEGLKARAAVGHRSRIEAVPGGWHVYPELAAAGLWTTPRDLARLAISVMEASAARPQALLQPPLAADMLRAQIAQRGLGWIVEGEGKARSFSHGGSNEGYRALMIAYPETCQGAVVMTNADGGRPLIHEVLRAIADRYHWPDAMRSTELEAGPVTPELVARFAGTWRLRASPDDTFRITADGAGGLNLVWPGRSTEALQAHPGGLFGPDIGILLKAAGTGPARVLTYTYALPGAGTYEAERFAPPAAVGPSAGHGP